MGKCLEIRLGVMLKVVLECLHEDPLRGKEEGRKNTKIGGMRRKGSRPWRRVVSNISDNVGRFEAQSF